MMIFINEIITPSTKSARSFFDEKTGTVLGGRKTGTVLEEKNGDGPEGRKGRTVPKTNKNKNQGICLKAIAKWKRRW